MSYIYREFPELSWSTSRIKILEKCERGYYYHYYLSHNGWNLNSTEMQKEAFMLKKLSSKDILCGSIVHKALKYLIVKNKKGIDITQELIDKITNAAIKEFRRCCDMSEKYADTWNKYTKEFDMLQEYFYRIDITEQEKTYIESKIIRCIKNGAQSTTFKYLQSNNIEVLELESDQFTYFYINGIKVYAKLDLLYVDYIGKYIVVDWKTGKEDIDNELQLAIYAKYISEKYNIKSSDIICRIEYVETNTFTEKVFSDEELKDISLIVNLSMKQMLDYLDDKTINKAREMIAFNRTKDAYKCKNCNFKKLCYEYN